LNLSASIRYDDNSDFDNVSTYRLTSSYLFSGTSTRLRASVGSGQKAPTFIELFGFFPGLFIGNPDLEPEKTQGFDIAVVQSWGQWQGSAGYFNERLTDEIATSFVPGTFMSTVVNLPGKSRRQGVELELNGQLTTDLRLQFSYTYTDSEQPDGSVEVRRPQHMAAANLNYRFADQRANVNLNLSYTGSQQDLVFLPPFFIPESVELDQYLLVDLSGRYALSKRLELNIRVENLFDEDYTTVVGYRTPGRGIYAGLRLGLAR
jgi:vitamin B12 transporter